MGITKEQIDEISTKLMNMPDVHDGNVSKQAAIAQLAKEINALKKRGYGLDEIAQELTKEGLPISIPTLKCYLQRAKPRTIMKIKMEKTNKNKAPQIITTANAKVVDTKGTFLTRPDSEEI